MRVPFRAQVRRLLGLGGRPLTRARRELLRQMPRRALCAEIGVWEGNFSGQILAETDPAELHLVDPWLFAPQHPKRMYGGKRATSQADMDEIASRVTQRFASDPRVRVHRLTSQAFFTGLGPAMLDWIYIDGDHSREAVLADLRESWRVVREGGWIAGDDYHWRDADGSLAVRLAVDQFAGEMKIDVCLIGSQYLLRH